MAWRVAKCLEVLREQINKASPSRSKASDGTIGDESHQSRDSDHNAWVKDGSMGVVTAMDITHDPAHGVDAGKLAEALRVSGDPRIKYIISNRRIANPSIAGGAWRPYTGSNPHDKHFHISVQPTKALYDSMAAWKLPTLTPDASSPTPEKQQHSMLRRGSKGEEVRLLQSLLAVIVDGDFGPKTEAAVKAFQKGHGLVADGIVGPYTWGELL
jgi:hypothetical protein